MDGQFPYLCRDCASKLDFVYQFVSKVKVNGQIRSNRSDTGVRVVCWTEYEIKTEAREQNVADDEDDPIKAVEKKIL